MKYKNIYVINATGMIIGVINDVLNTEKLTTILNDGTIVKLINKGRVIIGTIAGNDAENSEIDLNDLNYYIIPIGKTFNDEIMELWSNIEVLDIKGIDLDGDIITDSDGISYFINIREGIVKRIKTRSDHESLISSKSIFTIFTKLFPMCKNSRWISNGDNSIKLSVYDSSVMYNVELIFTYTNEKEWKFETIENYEKGLSTRK